MYVRKIQVVVRCWGMGFRDDREAMRAHVEALKEQLDEQRDANLELQKKMDALSKRVARLEPAPTSPAARQRTGALLVAAVGLLVGGAVLGFVMYRIPDAPEPTPEPIPEPVAAETPVPRPTVPAAPPTPARPIVPYDGMAEWAGAVSEVDGRSDVAAGDTCVVRAEARSLAYQLAPQRLEVRCGDALLYERAVSRNQPANAFERWECDVRGQREDEGGLYAMTCSDRGVRTDRPELELDTLTKRVRLWTDEYSVVIELEHAAVHTPQPMNPNIEMSLPIQQSLSRSGEVLRSNGPLTTGAGCELRLQPADQPDSWAGRHHNCRASLRCGGRSVVDQSLLCLVDPDLNLTGLRIIDEESPVAVQGDLETLNVASIGEDRTWHALIRFSE